MKYFDGFPSGMQFTPVPNIFFSSLLPQIDDIKELKTALHVLRALYYKKGFPAFVSYEELLDHPALMDSFRDSCDPPAAVRCAIQSAADRGIFIHLTLNKDGEQQDIYLINTDRNREASARIQSGALKLSGFQAVPHHVFEVKEQPDVFTLYEQNIGMLTPMIAEELRDAVKLYPEDWIKDAIKEAVNQNKRKWSYISAILESWLAEGRDGAHIGDSKKADRAKFKHQRYGHMVRG